VTANIRTQPCQTCQPELGDSLSSGISRYLCMCPADRRAEARESPAEQPWAVFCSTLDNPALLLPSTGFGDLE